MKFLSGWKIPPLPWAFFGFYLLLCTLPGIINHTAIWIYDFDLTLRNLMDFRPGLAYNTGHSAAAALLGILFHILLGRRHIIAGLVLFTLLLFYHYGDYAYYENFQTHMPFFVLGYGRSAGDFTTSVIYLIFRPEFLFMVVLPIPAVYLLYRYLNKNRDGWDRFGWSRRATAAALLLFVFVAGNAYGNSYDSKTDDNPLMFNVFRYLKITSKHGSRGSKPPEAAPPALLKTWPKIGPGWNYNFYAGRPDFPFLRHQPRVLCRPAGQSTPGQAPLKLEHSRQKELDEVFCDSNPETNSETQKKSRPNIILILLENFRAQSTGVLGKSDLTPNFDKLTEEGILFTNVYANCTRTKAAMVGTYCSVLSVPFLHIMRYYKKHQMLCLPEVMSKAGYHTAWLHNGDAGFDFRFNFFRRHGFKEIIDKYDLPSGSETAGWGPVDEVLYKKAAGYLQKVPRPYFVSLLTITNHHPYDAPPSYRTYVGDDDLKRYRDTQRYTDLMFGRFMKELRKLPDADNTILVITGDHGNHLLSKGLEDKKPHRYDRLRAHVPLLIVHLGKPFKMLQHQQLSLSDIPPTITDLAGVDPPLVPWFGLSAFIEDERRWTVTQIDRKYKALRLGGKNYFSGRLKTDGPFSGWEKKLQMYLDLNFYLLHNNRLAPAGGGAAGQ